MRDWWLSSPKSKSSKPNAPTPPPSRTRNSFICWFFSIGWVCCAPTAAHAHAASSPSFAASSRKLPNLNAKNPASSSPSLECGSLAPFFQSRSRSDVPPGHPLLFSGASEEGVRQDQRRFTEALRCLAKFALSGVVGFGMTNSPPEGARSLPPVTKLAFHVNESCRQPM